MTHILTEPEMLDGIAKIIADCVAIDVAAVKHDSRLIPDLGMDSLDFLDIIFGIEKRFSVKLKNTRFEKLLRLDLLQEKANTSDKLDHAELQPYLDYLPALETEDLEKGVTAIGLFSYITVDSLVIAVQDALSATPQPAM